MMCAASYATRAVPDLQGTLILLQNDADIFGRRAECRSGTAIRVETWARCQQLGAWNAGWASILGDMTICCNCGIAMHGCHSGARPSSLVPYRDLQGGGGTCRVHHPVCRLLFQAAHEARLAEAAQHFMITGAGAAPVLLAQEKERVQSIQVDA